MKKHYFFILASAALLWAPKAQAQTILSEDFETESTTLISQPVAAGEGWTTVDSYKGSKASYVWHNYYTNSEENPTINGKHCASCDGPISYSADGKGPREEILLSPELDLNDFYELNFIFKVSPMNAYDNSRYDLQVRVVEGNNLAGAETIFSIQNENMLRESGVMTFPISEWSPFSPKISLADWKGQKVRLAFVYKMMTDIANVVWLDDVKVYRVNEETGPRPVMSTDRYTFPEMYIGEKFYSEVITMTNMGLNGLKVTGIDLPAGMSCTLDPASVNLNKYENVQFQLAYSASLTSPVSGNVVIHTNGGDVNIAYNTTKMDVPEGYILENFEGYFPPAGWTRNQNGWTGRSAAIEGDQSAYATASLSNSYLVSPRLDLSHGGQLTFTYYNFFESFEGDTYQMNDFSVEVSYDGGQEWVNLWTFNYELMSYGETKTLDLGTGTNNSKVRFVLTGVTSQDGDIDPFADVYLDRVLLPNVYGANGVPKGVTMISPKLGAHDIYPRDIKLEWGPAQFAEGYKVYVGSNDAADNLVNGVDVQDALTFTIPEAGYETTYYWKVVPYNSVGSTNDDDVLVWSFTTQPDASVMEFPYEENFDELTSKDPPTGWLSTTTAEWENRRWEPLNTNKAYGGTGISMYTMWLNAGKSSTLTSPQFNLPADGQSMSISFVWGDNHPVDLIIDESGLLEKQNVPGGNGYSDVVFEIYSDGEWHQAAYLSENYNEDGDTKYWRNETVDLQEYAGKTVQFRWINNSYGSRHRGAALDNIVIDGTVESGVMFNKNGWDALKVNYQKATNSGDIFTIKNNGKQTETVKSVTFNTNDFVSSIPVGQQLAAGSGIPFNITFTANNPAQVVEDVMTVEFESGMTATFPVRGEGLAEDVLYYGFEMNPLDYDWKTDFTMIDVDKQVNYKSNYYLTILEDDGGRYAFTQVTNNNIDNLPAHSGTHTIAACAPDNNSAADDWLISKQIVPQAGATFDFYARNLGTTNSVFVGDNDLHCVTVLVSETDNSKTSNFTVVMRETEMPYLDGNNYNHYTVDLSAYEGKPIYVALRHTTVSANWFALFDDFTFTHVGDVVSGIEEVNNSVRSNAEVSVYNANGVLVKQGLGNGTMQSLERGLYIVKVKEGDSVKTYRVTKK